MASLVENLIDVLNKECSEYEALLELSQSKTPVIVAGNLEEMNRITDEEQIVVNRINHLDGQRCATMVDIANVINKDVETLKLDNVITMLSSRPSEQKQLAEAHDHLKNVVANLARVNENNRELLQTAMSMLEFEMNMVNATRTAPEMGNYNKGAMNSGYTMGTTPSGFDAKQ